MMTSLDSLIACDSNIRHGRPCIAGIAITVHRIAIWYQLGHSAEEIAREYPHISLEGVYAALAYYLANRQTIDTEIESDEATAEKLEKQP
ncbi:MAG: DUF433 domain-containing protein [Cyanobacteria bacterium J06627_28]